MGNSDKIILDLCGGTGSWSRPYKEAGYDVRLITLPDYDVRTYQPPEGVYGILAAPPCTEFSIAKNGSHRSRNLHAGMEIVEACLRIIWDCRIKAKLQFWAMGKSGWIFAAIPWQTALHVLPVVVRGYRHKTYRPVGIF